MLYIAIMVFVLAATAGGVASYAKAKVEEVERKTKTLADNEKYRALREATEGLKELPLHFVYVDDYMLTLITPTQRNFAIKSNQAICIEKYTNYEVRFEFAAEDLLRFAELIKKQMLDDLKSQLDEALKEQNSDEDNS